MPIHVWQQHHLVTGPSLGKGLKCLASGRPPSAQHQTFLWRFSTHVLCCTPKHAGQVFLNMLARYYGLKAVSLSCLLAEHASHCELFATCLTKAVVPRKVSRYDPNCHHRYRETVVLMTNHTLSCPAAGAHSSAPQKTVSRKQLQFAPLHHEPSETHAAASHADDGCCSLTAAAVRMQNVPCCKTCLPMNPLLPARPLLWLCCRWCMQQCTTADRQQEAAAVCTAATWAFRATCSCKPCRTWLVVP